MNDDKERKEKSDKLFEKGMECYNNQQYKEALNYFEACIKFHQNDRAELFIKVCKNNIPEEDNKKSNNNTSYNNNSNNFHKSYSQSNFSYYNNSNKKVESKTSNNNFQNKSYSTENIGENNEDKICKELKIGRASCRERV